MTENELVQLQIKLALPPHVKGGFFMGSIFHGLLMDLLPMETRGWLHTCARRPYSQYLLWNHEEQTLSWTINSLQRIAYESIIEPMLAVGGELELKQKGYSVQVIDKNIIRSTCYEELVDYHLGGECTYKIHEINLRTPTTFKHNGMYTLFPDISLLYGNLLNRWNIFSTSELLDDKEMVSELMRYTACTGYRINMYKYPLEKVRIPAFMGKIMLSGKQSIMMQRVLSLLVDYSNFSGIGIKTALGMGGTLAKGVDR